MVFFMCSDFIRFLSIKEEEKKNGEARRSLGTIILESTAQCKHAKRRIEFAGLSLGNSCDY